MAKFFSLWLPTYIYCSMRTVVRIEQHMLRLRREYTMEQIHILLAVIPGADKASSDRSQTIGQEEPFRVEEIRPERSHAEVTTTEHFGSEDTSKIDREIFETLKSLGLEGLAADPKYMDIVRTLRQMRNTPYLGKERNPIYIDFSRWRMPVHMIELPPLRNEASRSLTPKVPRKAKACSKGTHRDHSRQDTAKNRDLTRRAERARKQTLTTYA